MTPVITHTDVALFSKMYKARFGIELNRDQAFDKLNMLLRQIEMVYTPIMASSVLALSKNGDEYEHRTPQSPGQTN